MTTSTMSYFPPSTGTTAPTMAPSQPIQPPQPIPFIPMVPPLANTFTSTMHPSVTSALVDNLINNNPTQSSAAATTVTSSAVPQNISQVRATASEANANTSAIDSLATNTASQLFISAPNASHELIKNEQSVIQPPSSIPAFYQTSAAPPTAVNQQFVQSEGELFNSNARR